jgi:hypothetical protein
VCSVLYHFCDIECFFDRSWIYGRVRFDLIKEIYNSKRKRSEVLGVINS